MDMERKNDAAADATEDAFIADPSRGDRSLLCFSDDINFNGA